MHFSKSVDINLDNGFLFRPIANKPFSSSAAEVRLKTYLNESGLCKGNETLHGFRAGCAITLALTGSELEDIMSHVGWRHSNTAAYYMQLAKVMSAASPSARLSGTPCDVSQAGAAYNELNSLQGFTPAFP